MKMAWRLVLWSIAVFGIWEARVPSEASGGFGISHAAVPPMMSYQGKLTDAAGKLVADGAYEMRFSLYDSDSGGSALWTEPWEAPAAVQAANGMFSVLLGTHAPIDLPFDGGYWLGIEVKHGGSWETLAPRQRIASAAYAFRAGKADEAGTALEADSVKDGAITLAKLGVPVVSGMDPGTKTAGYSSFTATISGENFSRFSRAKIGGAELIDENATSSTTMTATVPADFSAGVYDVFVSNSEWDWGEGSGLFTVHTPTPSATPTVTPTQTGTPTITPTPFGAAQCAAKSGTWDSDGLGGSGCWFRGNDQESCTNACVRNGLVCDTRDWRAGSVAFVKSITGNCGEPTDAITGSYAPMSAFDSNGGPCYGFTGTGNDGIAQDCDALPWNYVSWSPDYRACVCKP